jgi:hypothetical protein
MVVHGGALDEGLPHRSAGTLRCRGLCQNRTTGGLAFPLSAGSEELGKRIEDNQSHPHPRLQVVMMNLFFRLIQVTVAAVEGDPDVWKTSRYQYSHGIA